jgi:ATP-binding cassette subfamily B protein
MDRVLVFSAGKIVEDGTVNELIARQGQFSKMSRLQAGGFLPEAVTG